MRLILWIIGLVMALAVQANAWPREEIGIMGRVQDMQRHQWVVAHMRDVEPDIVAPIDGPEPAVEISMTRNGLPDEFEIRVAKLNKIGERYGR